MNPIENLCSLLKVKVAVHHSTAIKGLKKEIKTDWNNLSKELESNLAASMERCVLSIIDSKGDYAVY